MRHRRKTLNAALGATAVAALLGMFAGTALGEPNDEPPGRSDADPAVPYCIGAPGCGFGWVQSEERGVGWTQNYRTPILSAPRQGTAVPESALCASPQFGVENGGVVWVGTDINNDGSTYPTTKDAVCGP